MKILMLVNWSVNKKNFNKSELQSSNFFDGKEYWFFKNILSQNDKIDVIGLETCPKISKFEYRFFKVYIFQTIKNLFKFNSYDVVISHGANSGIILALIRRFFKTRYKHVLFDIGSFRSAEKGNGFVNKLIKFASKSIDYVFYHSSSQLNYYSEEFPWLVNKSKFLRFGVDLNYFKIGKKTKPIYSGICIGSSMRDWETFFKAIDKMNVHLPFLVLGKEKSDFTNLNVPNNVVFIRSVSSEKMKELIQKSIIGILPLKNYNYSYGQMTFLDQGALKLPLVAAYTNSLKDYGENGKTCLFYEPENYIDLRNKIIELLNNNQKRESLSENNYEFIRKYCDENKLGEEVYKELALILYEI